MRRVHVICEGQTEEMFLNEVINRELLHRGLFLQPTLIGKPGHKGGHVNARRLFIDIRERLLSDTTSYCTTLIDFYGLPEDFPGKAEAARKATISEKARCVESALSAVIHERLTENRLRAKAAEAALLRFIPYVQMHEYEGLLFSDPAAMAKGIDKPHLTQRFASIRADFATPEDINDDPTTAPSKRIIQLVPGYAKPIQGSLAAMEVGVAVMRQECSLFDSWLKKLEALAPAGKSLQ